MHATLEKFGYPDSTLHEYQHWCVLLRPQQVTLGSLVLAARSDALAFSHLSQAAISELSGITQDIENTLQHNFQYTKLNYLMLMMVDPHVHFHVIPRYASQRDFLGLSFVDQDRPKPPDLSRSCIENIDKYNELHTFLAKSWQNH